MRPAVDELAAGKALSWPLPPARECAGVARSLVGDVLATLQMPPGAIHDAQIMISELASNAYEHARSPVGEDRGPCELWMYRLGHHIVCGVFDPVPERPLPQDETPLAGSEVLEERGRGLGVVHAYSHGRWGTHRTRAQLGAHLPGKVIWFMCPAQVGAVLDLECPVPGGDAGAMGRSLRDRLSSRRVDGTILRALPDLAVLSVCHGLAVWCRDGRFHLRDEAPAETMARPGNELAAVVEHVVRRYEELRNDALQA